jgi:acyl-CoA reductase-like NAD-dependent aldehyde dehydrogenase
VFTQDINLAIRLSDSMETGTVQVNAAPARGPDHFPFQVRWAGCGMRIAATITSDVSQHPTVNMCPAARVYVLCANALHFTHVTHVCFLVPQGVRDSGIGSQGITNSLEMMVKTKSTVINLDKESYTLG